MRKLAESDYGIIIGFAAERFGKTPSEFIHAPLGQVLYDLFTYLKLLSFENKMTMTSHVKKAIGYR